MSASRGKRVIMTKVVVVVLVATLLVAIGVSALMLAPNRDRLTTSLALAVVAVTGLAAWRVLEKPAPRFRKLEAVTEEG